MGTRSQCMATLCVNILSTAYGLICGWPSPAFDVLQSNDTPLKTGPLNMEEASWISSIMCLGGAAGNILFGWLSERIGRKKALYLAAVFQSASWALIVFAVNPTHLIIARFLAGISGGGSVVLILLFVTEISDDKIRGVLGSSTVFHINFGIMLSFLFGKYLPYTTAGVVSLILPLVFIAMFIFFPETPSYLQQSGDLKEAKKSTIFYRGHSKFVSNIDDSLLKNETEVGQESNVKLSLSDFNNVVARKAFLIGLALVTISQFCGNFAMLNYASSIFAASGSAFSAQTSGIIVTAIQLFSSMVSSVLVDKFGRKFLLSFSSFGTSTGLMGLGTYTYLSKLELDLSAFGWVPVLSFSLMIFAATVGLVNLTMLVVSEIMPQKIRAFGTSFCMLFMLVLSFGIVKIFPFLTELLGLHGCMFLFTFNSFVGGLFVLTVLPETKGKSTEEIRILMGGHKYKAIDTIALDGE